MSYFDGTHVLRRQGDDGSRSDSYGVSFPQPTWPLTCRPADVTRKNRDLRGEDLNFVHKHEAAPQKELERLQKMLTSGSFNVELLGPSVQRFFVVLLAGRGL